MTRTYDAFMGRALELYGSVSRLEEDRRVQQTSLRVMSSQWLLIVESKKVYKHTSEMGNEL